MKLKYLYQQLGSHVSVILIAFLILSLLFSQFVERFVYENKAEELISYGQNILQDLERSQLGSQKVLGEYGRVLAGRDIEYSLFDEHSAIIYSMGEGPVIQLRDKEWEQIQNGETVIVKKDYKRFEEGVTFVLLPYVHQDRFIGGILLASPIKGSRAVIAQINEYLFYTVLFAIAVSVLLSWVLSAFHVQRIKRIQEATSLVAGGNYDVKLPASDVDEIGDLAGDFNLMVEQLKKSREEIESLENRRRQFMADVSHELRTPLTTISGIIEGIRNDMIPESEREKGMQLASKETKRLLRLVNENLDYEKIRSNQIKLHKEEIEAAEVLEIIKEQLHLFAEEKNDQIFIEAEQGVQVYADYDRLIQILINIARNSIQFTDNGSIYLRARHGDGASILEIEDTGAGIDPGEIERIWSRFYKAMLSRTTNPYGEFGLGLSIVKQLVAIHEGTIEVSSEKGKGTKFTINFPEKANAGRMDV